MVTVAAALELNYWEGPESLPLAQVVDILQAHRDTNFEKKYPDLEMCPGTIFIMRDVEYSKAVEQKFKLEGWKDCKQCPDLCFKSASQKSPDQYLEWHGIPLTLRVYALRAEKKNNPVKFVFVTELSQRAKNRREKKRLKKDHSPTDFSPPQANPSPPQAKSASTHPILLPYGNSSPLQINYSPPQANYSPPQARHSLPEGQYSPTQSNHSLSEGQYWPTQANGSPQAHYSPTQANYSLPENQYSLQATYSPPEANYSLPEAHYSPTQAHDPSPQNNCAPPLLHTTTNTENPQYPLANFSTQGSSGILPTDPTLTDCAYHASFPPTTATYFSLFLQSLPSPSNLAPPPKVFSQQGDFWPSHNNLSPSHNNLSPPHDDFSPSHGDFTPSPGDSSPAGPESCPSPTSPSPSDAPDFADLLNLVSPCTDPSSDPHPDLIFQFPSSLSDLPADDFLDPSSKFPPDFLEFLKSPKASINDATCAQ